MSVFLHGESCFGGRLNATLVPCWMKVVLEWKCDAGPSSGFWFQQNQCSYLKTANSSGLEWVVLWIDVLKIVLILGFGKVTFVLGKFRQCEIGNIVKNTSPFYPWLTGLYHFLSGGGHYTNYFIVFFQKYCVCICVCACVRVYVCVCVYKEFWNT